MKHHEIKPNTTNCEQTDCPCYRVLTLDELLILGIPKGQLRTVHQPDCPVCDGTGVIKESKESAFA